VYEKMWSRPAISLAEDAAWARSGNRGTPFRNHDLILILFQGFTKLFGSIEVPEGKNETCCQKKQRVSPERNQVSTGVGAHGTSRG
jgi:hypothetical protein